MWIDTWEVSNHYETELFGQIPTAKALERKRPRHERGALPTRTRPPAWWYNDSVTYTSNNCTAAIDNVSTTSGTLIVVLI